MKRMYMHMINGQPAFFDGEMVCYMNHAQHGHHRQAIVPSLKQLRAEQKASLAYRKRNNYADHVNEYSYCIVGVPEKGE
jgi:hypothetical protein